MNSEGWTVDQGCILQVPEGGFVQWQVRNFCFYLFVDYLQLDSPSWQQQISINSFVPLKDKKTGSQINSTYEYS
jgi:hypothetical protein